MPSFESELFQYIENVKMQVRSLPLNLGGQSSLTTSGVTTGPPGGYIGYLPQYRVNYDPLEAATLTNASGVTLVDNLNHIRYRLETLEASGVGGAGFMVKQDSTTIATGVTVLDFVGATVSTITGGARITISGTGASSGITVKESDGSPSVSNVTVLAFEGGTVTDNGGGQATVTLSGVSGGAMDVLMVQVFS